MMYVVLAGTCLAAIVGPLILHSAACDLHVQAVDGLRDPVDRAREQGRFYKYCRIVAAPFRRWRSL